LVDVLELRLEGRSMALSSRQMRVATRAESRKVCANQLFMLSRTPFLHSNFTYFIYYMVDVFVSGILDNSYNSGVVAYHFPVLLGEP
jgi:hypothetical protein